MICGVESALGSNTGARSFGFREGERLDTLPGDDCERAGCWDSAVRAVRGVRVEDGGGDSLPLAPTGTVAAEPRGRSPASQTNSDPTPELRLARHSRSHIVVCRVTFDLPPASQLTGPAVRLRATC